MTYALRLVNPPAALRRERALATPSQPRIAALAAPGLLRWRRRLERFAWLLLEPFLPGATLFVLLVVLSLGYLRQGFGAVRHHALAPDAGKGTVNATSRRQWWHCPCASLLACRCLQATARRIRDRTHHWARSLCAGCR